MRYGLIGETLKHSYSARLHALLGDESYTLTPVARGALDAFLTQRDFEGLNVTIPYKRDVIPYCAQLGETAQQIGSVNTLVKRADGTLFGDNTDAYGFAKMAEIAGIQFEGRKALVLGSGGTSLTACYVIRKAGGEAVIISRNGDNGYDQLQKNADAAVLVNATPVGMQVEEEERVLMSKEDAINQLTTLTAGRSAEEVVFQSITSGASNDIEKATAIARAMVTRFGMSEQFDMRHLAQHS